MILVKFSFAIHQILMRGTVKNSCEHLFKTSSPATFSWWKSPINRWCDRLWFSSGGGDCKVTKISKKPRIFKSIYTYMCTFVTFLLDSIFLALLYELVGLTSYAHMLDFKVKIARNEVWTLLHYIHFEIANFSSSDKGFFSLIQ